jgi:ABC-type branched-subunit amino acid transport system ATPase component
MLDIQELDQYYGGVHPPRQPASRNRQVTCLLGRNGVGKSTCCAA